jgi:hypothetical protein
MALGWATTGVLGMTALDGLWQTAPAYLDSALRISSPQFLDEAKISTENIGIWQGAIAQELKCEVVRLSGGTSTGILVVTANKACYWR